MKPLPVRIACFTLVALLLSGPLRAALISYEGFGYAANAAVNSASGGTGWQSGWAGGGTVPTPGLTRPGLMTAGNSLRFAGTASGAFRPFTTTGFAGLRTGGKFGLDGTELWFSFLIRRAAGFPANSWGGVSLFNGNTEKIFIGTPSGATHWTLQQYTPGIVVTPSTAPVVVGETTLLVLHLTFGVNGTQDRVELYVNPPSDVTPTVPAATRTGPDLQFDRVRAQSGPAVANSAAIIDVDEIRLGESFADVTPFVPGPGLAWSRPGSQRVSAGAEITLPLAYAWPDGDATTLGLEVRAADPTLLPVDRIVVSGTGVNRRVTFRPPAGSGGTTTVTATLTPPGGAAVTADFSLTVDPTPPEGLLAYEPLDYTPTASLISGRSGGQGFAGAWAEGIPGTPSGSGFAAGSSNLVFAGLATAGVRTRISTTLAQAIQRATAVPLGEDGTVRYASLLVRPDNVPSATAYFGLLMLGGEGVNLFVGKPGGGQSQRYVLEDGGGARQVPTTRPVVSGETVLLVVKLEFRQGADRVSLFVNPPLTGAEPAVANAVKQDADLGLISALALNSAALCSMDELRVGTTFASVTRPGLDFALKPITSSFNVLEDRLFSLPIETLAPLPAGRTLRYQLVGDSFGAQVDAATGTFTWLPDEAEGLPGGGPSRQFTARATSNATPPQADEVSFRVRVTEVNLPPQLAIPDLTVEEGTPLSYQILAPDPDIPVQQPSPSFSLLLGPAGLALSPAGLLTWTPTPAQLDRTFTNLVRVTDAAGARAEQVFILVTRSRGGGQLTVHLNAVLREDGRFSVEVKAIAGVDLSLWRSPDLTTWERVPNVETQQEGLTIRFTDPAPPAAGAFYEIRP